MNEPDSDEDGDGAGTRHQVSAEAGDDGERLDRLIAARVSGLTRSRVKALIETGQVSLRGGQTISQPYWRVEPGQIFAHIVPEPEAALQIGNVSCRENVCQYV